jgi:hypothetical protein
MTTMHPRLAGLRVAVCLGIVGSLAALTGSAARPPQKKAAVAVRPTPAPKTTPAPGATWKDVDRLVSEQKLAEALEKVDAILASARSRRDDAEWTRALIRSVQLRTALHGYETAVRFLKDQAWPRTEIHRAALQLFYAQSLVNYSRAYSWEIARRERVTSDGPVDLKAWTRDQIAAEAERAYLDVWKQRDALGKLPVGAFAEYVEPNDYPKEIRGTLRDAVSYLFVQLLADSSLWTPAQSSEVSSLDLGALLSNDERDPAAALANAAAHPAPEDRGGAGRPRVLARVPGRARGGARGAAGASPPPARRVREGAGPRPHPRGAREADRPRPRPAVVGDGHGRPRDVSRGGARGRQPDPRARDRARRLARLPVLRRRPPL